MKRPINKFKKRKYLGHIFIGILIFLIITSFISLNWYFTKYHEEGHMKACKTVDIHCTLKDKSFSEYVSFSIYNLIKNPGKAVSEMEVIPENISEFCELSFAQQQLIRVGGFRNDLKVIKTIQYLLLIESIIFLGGLGYIGLLLTKKKIRLNQALLILIILFAFVLLTVMLLNLKITLLESYFTKNFIGDLFYFPCS